MWMNYIIFLGIVYKNKIKNYLDIPIIINNRNRLSFLRDLINSLEKMGYKNIHIIDNNSSYPPLIEYYNKCPYKVYRLDKNIGYLALWKTEIYKKFIKDYYVYTDSDVVPIQQCPSDFLNIFFEKMKNNKQLMKIGLGLKIDDLPDHFHNKFEVIKWESQYQLNQTQDGYFIAGVDTTFALYRPFMKGGASGLKMLRSKFPYEAHHMPWYNDSDNLSDEEIFYIKSATASTHWTSK